MIIMDPERQPLLRAGGTRGRFRPLTTDEVVEARNNIVWRRTRFLLVLMFWAIMAMFLSIITCILATAQCKTCEPLDNRPSVPPVHMSFAPLISRLNDEQVYTL